MYCTSSIDMLNSIILYDITKLHTKHACIKGYKRNLTKNTAESDVDNILARWRHRPTSRAVNPHAPVRGAI